MNGIDWDALFREYKTCANGLLPRRIYLHPDDFNAEKDRAIVESDPADVDAEALLWGIPVFVSGFVPKAHPVLWPPSPYVKGPTP